MPQLQLPIFPDGTKEINRDLGVQCADGKVVYLHGHLPVFQHEETDLRSFRLFTSQIVANGLARAREVSEAFGVPLGTVKRYTGLFRREGPAGFYQSKPRQRSETKLIPEIKERAQALLGAGCSVAEAARQTGVLATTLHKAIRAKRLPLKKRNSRRRTRRLRQHQKRAQRAGQPSPNGPRHDAQFGTGGGRDGGAQRGAGSV